MKPTLIAYLALLSAGAALAQEPDLEPGVQTSPPVVGHAPASDSQGAQTKASATASRGEVSTPNNAQATSAPSPAPASKAASAPNGTPALQRGQSGDRLQLETTEITGNRELPRVMYVVPWRKDDLAQYAGRPPNSLLDEALTPVDRDVFRRQAQYYDALKAGAASANSQPRAQATPSAPRAPQDEK